LFEGDPTIATVIQIQQLSSGMRAQYNEPHKRMSTQIDNWVNLSSVKVCEYFLNASIHLTNASKYFLNALNLFANGIITRSAGSYYLAEKLKWARTKFHRHHS
jgi:hypothetical protein